MRTPSVATARNAHVVTGAPPGAVRLEFLSWNLRHAGVELLGEGGALGLGLAALRPAVALLQECPRRALPPQFMVEGPDGARTYRTVQGLGGGDQRLAIVYDLERARLKRRPTEILEDKLRRPPLAAVFALLPDGLIEPVDLHLVNVHLLSRGGDNIVARLAEAQALADWIEKTAPEARLDLMVGGDWNGPANDEMLEPLTGLERRSRGAFQQISAGSEAGYYLAGLRARPHPEHVRGERFLDIGFNAQSNVMGVMKPKPGVALTSLAERIDARKHRAFSDWLKARPYLVEAAEFAPNTITLYFPEYEPE